MKAAGSQVEGYCETQHPTSSTTYQFITFPISSATHAYMFTYDSFDGFWDCFVDGAPKHAFTSGSVGFTSSSLFIEVGGETKADHGQIGRMSGATLLFSDMQYRRASDGQWPALNVTLSAPPTPYGNSEPNFGQLRVWTNAH
jgi:hypothetical protein